MSIRRTKTKAAAHGEDSDTYRIVESVRVGTQVKQRTILNLGKDFGTDPVHWPLLTARIEQFLQVSATLQVELLDLADGLGRLLEAAAERYSDLIIAKLAINPWWQQRPVRIIIRSTLIRSKPFKPVASMWKRWRGMWSCNCKWIKSLLPWVFSAAALGTIIGRMVSPGSEL